MKKKLLFVIESLVCAGAEKSLVTLLNILDYSKYDVDLQLFAYGGEFQPLVPKEVNILPTLGYFKSATQSLAKCFLGNPKHAVSRLRYSLRLRSGCLTHPQKAVLFWQCAHNCFPQAEKEYDVAIAYAQGTPTFYVADCIKAKKKIAWINVTYKPDGVYREFIDRYYDKFDRINCVSESAHETFKEIFPERTHKSVVILDINDYSTIAKFAKLESSVNGYMNFNGTKILTVGRLAPQKGYDIALEACKILKERNVDFCWYVLGRGSQEQEIREYIKRHSLENHFILLGTRANPYPYYLNSDIYVQTSKFEGFGLAIAEARMLNIPVVTTRFDAVYAQMVENENGLVVDMTPEAVADGIERLISDKALYNHIREYQSQEKKGNTEEIEKFYELIEGKNG